MSWQTSSVKEKFLVMSMGDFNAQTATFLDYIMPADCTKRNEYITAEEPGITSVKRLDSIRIW